MYDIRKQVQDEFELEWFAYWHKPAQKKCKDLLTEVWLKEYKEKKKAGAQSPSVVTSRSRKSKLYVYLFQRYGGHQWVDLFFAFGIVDLDMVKIYNAEFKAKMLASGHIYWDPDDPVAGANQPSTRPKKYAGLHLSKRKRHKDYE